MTERLKKIVSFGVTQDSLGTPWWTKLEKLADEITNVSDEEALRTEIADADGLFLSLGRGASAELIESAPSLRYIGMLGTGYGGIDIEAAKQREITVTNIADYSTQGVAEFVFGAVISELRELGRARHQAADGDYDESSFAGTQISDKTVGVLGCGNIGGRVVGIAADGFGADVVCWSRASKPKSTSGGIEILDNPEEVIERAEILSIHLEHNPATDNFLDQARLSRIPDGALVINTAPMELVDLSALEKHLAEERFTFILDHSDEMKPEDVARLAEFDRCVVYPPIAYTTTEATEAKKEIFVTNLQSYMDGGSQNVVS